MLASTITGRPVRRDRLGLPPAAITTCSASTRNGVPVGVAVDAEAVNERHRELRSGTPYHVEAGDRVAGLVEAALHPVHDREEVEAAVAQPPVHLVRTAVHVLLGPAAGPGIVVLKLGERVPVSQRQLGRVVDAEEALLRGVDEKEAAERPASRPRTGRGGRGRAAARRSCAPAAPGLW